MSDGCTPYDCARDMRRFQREAPTCLRCPIPGGCDDTHPDCPLTPVSRKRKRKFRSALVAAVAKAYAGRKATFARRKRKFRSALVAAVAKAYAGRKATFARRKRNG